MLTDSDLCCRLLANLMLQALDIRDRVYMFRKFENCFVGNEAVEWMIAQQLVATIEEAVSVGQWLIDRGIIAYDSHSLSISR
jgi:hypothetical protein